MQPYTDPLHRNSTEISSFLLSVMCIIVQMKESRAFLHVSLCVCHFFTPLPVQSSFQDQASLGMVIRLDPTLIITKSIISHLIKVLHILICLHNNENSRLTKNYKESGLSSRAFSNCGFQCFTANSTGSRITLETYLWSFL